MTGPAGKSALNSSKDASFGAPFIDVDEWRDAPVRHRYVHGGFEDGDTRFSMYFPPAERYEGRFFHPVLPMSGDRAAATSACCTAGPGRSSSPSTAARISSSRTVGRANRSRATTRR